jgi:hypothetical protein
LCLVKQDRLQAARLHLGFDRPVATSRRGPPTAPLPRTNKAPDQPAGLTASANNPTFLLGTNYYPAATESSSVQRLLEPIQPVSHTNSIASDPGLRRATIDCSGIAQSTSNQQPTGQENLFCILHNYLPPHTTPHNCWLVKPAIFSHCLLGLNAELRAQIGPVRRLGLRSQSSVPSGSFFSTKLRAPHAGPQRTRPNPPAFPCLTPPGLEPITGWLQCTPAEDPGMPPATRP